ncbi:MAG: hypothetical protein ACLR4X_08215 [Clostridia bacterium]
MAKVIKEIIIMLVICLLTMLVLAIALYRYIPNRKAVPEVVTYTASEDVQDLLEDNIDTKSDQDNVILTYEVTASDLSGYQSTNTYVPGKSNPFASASSSASTDGGSDSNNSSDNNGTSQKNEQKNPNQSTESTAPSIYNGKGTK